MRDYFGMVKASDKFCFCLHPVVQSANEIATKFMLTIVLQDRQSAEFVVRGALRPVSPDCADRYEGWHKPQQEMSRGFVESGNIYSQ